MNDAEARSLLTALFRQAVASADPAVAVVRNLPAKPSGRCLVIGAGKAAAAMALALEQAWPDVDIAGVVATRYGHSAPCRRIRVIEAGHPVPDENSVAAAAAMGELVRSAKAGDSIVALVSGGGSACLALPADGLTLADKQAVTVALLRSGVPIGAMNMVRRSISGIKGGRLAAMAGDVPVHSLVISDVPGDNPADVASGPTVPCADESLAALAVLDEFGIAAPESVRGLLCARRAGVAPREQDRVALVASPAMALAAAAQWAEAHGLEAIILGDAIEGEAAEVAREMADTIEQLAARRGQRPLVLLSGGETTVTLPVGCNGRGGRNTEFQLALAAAMRGRPGLWSLAADSDGIDGVSDAAGAFVGPDTLARANRAGLSAMELLAEHRSYDFFDGLGDLLVTGPTLTNVNDIRIQLIGAVP